MTPISGGKLVALVPVKRLAGAKARLAPILDAPKRAALVEAMLGDVLDVLMRAGGLDDVRVISNDPSIAALSRKFGAGIFPDPAEGGINEAVLGGLRQLVSEGWRAGLIVPADVPYVSSTEIRMAISALGTSKVVLARASRDGGTNLLGLAPPDAIAPCFGLHSFAKHLSAARSAGIEPTVLAATGLAWDIDLPGDLVPLDSGGPAPRTRQFLAAETSGRALTI